MFNIGPSGQAASDAPISHESTVDEDSGGVAYCKHSADSSASATVGLRPGQVRILKANVSELGDKGIVDTTLDEQSRTCDARLTTAFEDAACGRLNGLVKFGVVENDMRRLST